MTFTKEQLEHIWDEENWEMFRDSHKTHPNKKEGIFSKIKKKLLDKLWN